ncbi:terminase small subunit [Mesorhizobium amorphae]|uniref:terminase small subunit n=1 Tax=Mesorhizobium amorphae TaxID=71433 RepID=UPI003F4F7B69
MAGRDSGYLGPAVDAGLRRHTWSSNTSPSTCHTAPFTADEKAGLFVQEYLLDLNATKAAIRSGFSAKTA